MPVDDLKRCRLTSPLWNYTILLSELLDFKSCFVFDGRRDDNYGGRCAAYIHESQSKNYHWSHLKFRRVSNRQTAWLMDPLENDPEFTFAVSKLEFLNCSINWLTILQMLIHLPNLEVLIDRQDMYCWDYQTFNSGIEENEAITENAGYLQLQNIEGLLNNLKKLKVAKIHRSQLVECTTYLKIFKLRCDSMRELELTTDQNFAPQRASLFYGHLAELMTQNKSTLKVSTFPYKLVCPSYDFRVTDEHHCFREFLNFITENRWFETLQMPVLESLSLQFGIIHADNQDLRTKLIPLLNSFPSLRNFTMQFVCMEQGIERFIEEFLRELHQTHFHVHLGLYMNDSSGPPNIFSFQSHLTAISIQTFREMARRLCIMFPAIGITQLEDVKELQYFNKAHGFSDFNMQDVVFSFGNLTHLNLVDHNSRLETRHSSEALATIEDAEMQLIIRHLRKLVSLQIIANLHYLTDSGMTGIDSESCKRMQVEGRFILQENDILGLPISKLEGVSIIHSHAFYEMMKLATKVRLMFQVLITRVVLSQIIL